MSTGIVQRVDSDQLVFSRLIDAWITENFALSLPKTVTVPYRRKKWYDLRVDMQGNSMFTSFDSNKNKLFMTNGNKPDALFIFIYFVIQPLHISGMFIVLHLEIFTVYLRQLIRV
jgi:hypothetical protein